MTSNAVSAVEFPGAARIHMGLAVADVERSTRFYQTLFGQPPSKQREGYAKFEPTDPSVNLSLSQTRLDHGAKALPAHYGIQVKSSTAVAEAVERFRAAGMTPHIEEQTACCYAVQDKAWVSDPDGNQWEIFVVTDSDSPERKEAGSTCCQAEDHVKEAVSACC